MDDRDLLIRYLEGNLPDAERNGVRSRLREEPELRSALDELQALSATLKRSAARSFAPFFSTRVLARIREAEGGSAESLYESLRWMFARLAVICLLMAVCLGAYSAVGGGYGGSIVEAMLGLPETTLETALTLGG